MASNPNSSMRMWSYWRDKYGTVTALQDYYPALLADDPVIRTAAANIEINRAAVELRMTSLREAHGDEWTPPE